MVNQPATYEAAMFALIQARLERDEAIAALQSIQWKAIDYFHHLQDNSVYEKPEYIAQLDGYIRAAAKVLRGTRS